MCCFVCCYSYGTTRRVARIWKRGGGYFERVKSVQTTLTRIFIDLKSVSNGLSKFETKCLEKIENSNVFSAKNLVISKKKKKKKVFAKIQSDFSAEIQNSNVFSAQNQVISKKEKKKKKKKVFAKIQSDFSAEIQNSNVFSAQNQLISKK